MGVEGWHMSTAVRRADISRRTGPGKSTPAFFREKMGQWINSGLFLGECCNEGSAGIWGSVFEFHGVLTVPRTLVWPVG
jgi:hypothetical protein